jgi:hypothetical protein
MSSNTGEKPVFHSDSAWQQTPADRRLRDQADLILRGLGWTYEAQQWHPPEGHIPRRKAASAVATLEQLGYDYAGGTLWRPPIGQANRFNGAREGAIESFRAEARREFIDALREIIRNLERAKP